MGTANITNEVIRKIKEMITESELQPGERFPSERVLAERFGVSRNTVREALSYLETVGLASKKRGSGTYLIDDQDALQKVLDARQMLERYNPLDMIQARKVLEIGIAEIAAKNAGREDKIALRNALRKVEKTSKETKTEEGINAHILADYNLHRQIALATHNPVLIELHSTLKASFMASVKVWQSVSDKFDVANPAHAGIVEAICGNNPKAASEGMEKHIQHMEWLIDLSMNADI